MRFRSAGTVAVLAALALGACSDSTAPATSTFLQGTATDHGIALSLPYSTNALQMLQTGNPAERRNIALGSSATITPVGMSILGTRAIVPLGDAASVALVDLSAEKVLRNFIFPSGNATGSAWVNANLVVACNPLADLCGRFSPTQPAKEISATVTLTPFPTAVVVSGNRVFIISSNLDDNYAPIGPGVVTEINPTSMTVVRTFNVGTNPSYGAIAPNGKLYVTNSGGYGNNDGTLSVINLETNTVEATLTGFGDFPGPIMIDSQGRAFISSFNYGTIAWSTTTSTFLRDPSNPICVPTTPGGTTCLGASDASLAPNGNLYQSFFGSAADGQPAYYYVYNGSTFAVQDSIAMPVGPSGLVITTF